MRKLTGAVFLSLDGVMQAPGGPEEDPTGGFRFGGWTAPFWDEDMGPFEKVIESDYDLLLAKRTYDIFSAYWPYNQDNPIGAKFQRINKYVLTHSDEPLSWDHSHKLSGETAAAVAELKRSEGRDLLIQGSSTLYPPLVSAGLIDRLVLMTFPVVLGDGKSIFDSSQKPVGLKLVDSFVSGTGVVTAIYEPTGEYPNRYVRNQGAERGGAGSSRKMGSGGRMSLEYFGHPFSSYTQKVLIALWADETEFNYRMIEDPENMEELRRHSPYGLFPLLIDDGRPVFESSSIIEHLHAHHRGANDWIPEGETGRQVRFLDRFFDLYVMGNMQQAGRRYDPSGRQQPRSIRRGEGARRPSQGLRLA